MRRLPVLMALAALAACDAAAPEPTLTAVASIDAVEAVPSTPPTTLDVAGWFTATDLDGPLAYVVRSSDESVATVSLDGSEATLTFGRAGRAVVTATASGGGVQATASLPVAVGFGPAADEADFIPMAPGTVWDFDYSFHKPCPAPETRRTGRVTLTFLTQPPGYEGTREITAEMRATYVEETDDGGQIETDDVEQEATVTLLETRDGVQFADPALLALDFRMPFEVQRYYDASLDFVSNIDGAYRRYVLLPESTPELGTTDLGCVSSPIVSFVPRED